MPILDMRTIMVTYALCTAICSVAVGIRWLQYRDRYRGMGFWFAFFLLQCSGLLLIMFRGFIPDFFSMTLANGAIIAGFILLFHGFMDFYGKRISLIPDWMAFSVFLCVLAWFTLVKPDLRARELVFNAAMILACLRVFFALVAIRSSFVVSTKGVLFLLAAFVLASVLRILFDLLLPVAADFVAAPSLDAWFIVAFFCIFIGLSFSLMGLPSRRVLEEEIHTIEEKDRIMQELRESEEKRSMAFLASPDAISIARLDDGRFIEVNDSFCSVFGYTRDEALAARFDDIAKDKGALATIVKEVFGIGVVRNFDMSFLRKPGDALRSSLSGCIIELKGEKHLLSIISGTSGREMTEMVLRARLNLWDYSSNHGSEEIMVRALDEIEAMTGSRIGFYHFVDEDTGALSLQAWSTATTERFCRVGGKGQHYGIDQAGVWADSLRLRGPIVHNDYASLPNKKGMPLGHAQLRRELVAPTFRDGKIVAILGVGNKDSDYSEADLSLVSYVADLIWTIIVQKRADERILELNGALEELAMKDELTGMANRRAFFAFASRDLQKAKRYSTPIAFIMIDIDHFKETNDENGHDFGDAALAKVSSTISAGVRDVDVAARLGGEEFGIFMPQTNLADAAAIAERIRVSVSEACAVIKGRRLGITVSAGVAGNPKGSCGLDELMRKADEALYRAKTAGRNRTETA
jgi:diguanylate cyclase (GGDEF)-like protein/PAS domain S-box-containing protein